MIINKSVGQLLTDRETTQWSTRLALCEIADGQAELGDSRGIARKHRDSSSTTIWTAFIDLLMPLPKDFFGEVEVVSNIQDFTDLDSESAQTLRGVYPPMHHLSRAIFSRRLAQGCGSDQKICF